MNIVKRGHKAINSQIVNKRNKTTKVVISILLAISGIVISVMAYQYTYSAKLEVELNNKANVIEQKSTEIKKQSETLNLSEAQKQELQKQVDELNKQKEELNKQLQAKQAEKARVAQIQAAQAQSAPKVVNSTAPTQTADTSDAKAFIYQKESGNNPAAVNPIGCRGLGQACPGSKLPCSNSDYACQDAWFTNYAMQRYGSWENAKAFWILNHWW